MSGPLTYWTGSEWSTDPTLAANIAPGAGPNGETRVINPMQIALVEGHWIAVTKEGDWWGTTTYLDTAPSPMGPWTSVAAIPAESFGSDFNTYFASIVAGDADGIVVGLSNNRWDGAASNAYHPTFSVIPLSRWIPPVATVADRARPAGRLGIFIP
jgi:hypothetical protein